MPDAAAIVAYLEPTWEHEVLPVLSEYIAVPALSPAFDPDWERTGRIEEVVSLAQAWAAPRLAALDAAATCEVHRLPGRTPVLLAEVPATRPELGERTVLVYGHLDKQPEMVGWRDGLGPWEPVREGDLLYGRGGADDGYATFAAVTALEALRAAGGDHARIVLLVESCEESGSPDLPAHLAALGDRIGTPDLVVGLDSGAGSYDRLWVTDSLRGLLGGTLTVQVLTEGVHSGNAGGIVPSSFRILRRLLSRIEDEATGAVLVPELVVEPPAAVRAAVERTLFPEGRSGAPGAGADIASTYPWAGSTRPATEDPVELTLARNWGASVAVTGMDGIPPSSAAGNVLRPLTAARLSLRLPPTVDADVAADAVRRVLLADPPSGATVTFDHVEAAGGWAAPPTQPWLAEALDAASQATFGQPAAWRGEGGTIPFMGMLGAAFPSAQFVITGVLGPRSNAHGPNEFLHVPAVKAVTGSVSHLLAAHAARP